MLVLSRKIGEQIVIGDNITVVVNKVAGNRISLGIEAPANVRIVRGELRDVMAGFDDGHVSDPASCVGSPALELVSGAVLHRAR
ncbi:MAG: carbon storage regulator [Pirellulaceae bacterium]